MGEWMQPVPVKMGGETRAQLDALQDAFAPLETNRSQVVRASIEIAYRTVFGAANVPQLGAIGQGLQRSFVYHAVALLADFVNHNGFGAARIVQRSRTGEPPRSDLQDRRDRQLALSAQQGNKPFPPQRVSATAKENRPRTGNPGQRAIAVQRGLRFKPSGKAGTAGLPRGLHDRPRDEREGTA